ncbi:MAG: alkyl hydroperoxide reductase subunit F [Proteobacteria bacterium]|nr:alkyl hydroperoxide reductase subunit F [Pseudomonadota bacterium]
MLSQNIKDTLNQHFAKLNAKIQLVCSASDHPKQGELEQLLQSTAACHNHVEFIQGSDSTSLPSFRIQKNLKDTGISFTGIPSGHEFSSLVLAILNCDHIGQLPDDTIIARIKNLQGPINLKTFISLSCTNCPLIVQTLNLFTSFHPSMNHTMIDGSLAPEERERLQVSSVPSVYHGDQLIHAGRATVLELLEKLEQHFGHAPCDELVDRQNRSYDLVVVGGGPAGISAAIYSSRKGLSTALITETLGGQLNETVGIENFISIIYTEGKQLAAQLSAHIKEYPVDILEHRRVESLTYDDNQNMKELQLTTGEIVTAPSVIIASGARWRELGVTGEKKYLGKGVAYCPHCDGPYFKGQDVIVVGGGNSGIEAALDLSNIVKSVTVFEFQKELKADKVLVDVLQSRANAQIITSAAIQSIEGDGSKVTHITYVHPDDLNKASDEQKVMTFPTAAVFIQIGLIPNSHFLKDVVALSPMGEINIDAKNRTSVKGIYATGDVSTIPYKQIIISMGEGAKAALAAYEDRLTS